MSDLGNASRPIFDAPDEDGLVPGRPGLPLALAPAWRMAGGAAGVGHSVLVGRRRHTGAADRLDLLNAQHMTAGDMSPSAYHWLGADALKRDILSRILCARPNSDPGAAGPRGRHLAGVCLGLAAGYFGGWVDDVISRAVDVLLSFPKIVIYVVLIATVGPSRANIVAAVVLVAGPGIARLTRGLTLKARANDYVARGAYARERSAFIMLAEILPNIRGPLIVDACMRMGYTIIAIGVRLWSAFLHPIRIWRHGARGRERRSSIPHIALFPCFAIITLVLGFQPAGRRAAGSPGTALSGPHVGERSGHRQPGGALCRRRAGDPCGRRRVALGRRRRDRWPRR